MYAHPTMPTSFLLAYTLVTYDGLVWVEKFLNPTMSLKTFQPYPQTPKLNYGNKSRIC